jgi:thioredoxin 1
MRGLKIMRPKLGHTPVRAKIIVFVSLCSMTLIGHSMNPFESSAGAAEVPDSANADAVDPVRDLSSSDFKQLVLKSRQPVLIDFYAVWCGPCQKLAPVVADLSSRYSNKVSFYRVDVDKNQKLAAQYGISGIPAIKIFKNGQVVAESMGLRSQAEIKNMIDKALQ